MASITEIHDIGEKELDVFARLTEAQLKNKLSPENALFVAESIKVIKTALSEGYTPVSLLCERRHIEGDAKDLIDSLPDIPVYTADREILESLTGYALTRGVLCAMKRPPEKSLDKVLCGASRIAVLENITDATNMGAIFRSAAALNIDAVVLTPSCSDPFIRRTVRVSMGTVFQVPWCFFDESAKQNPEMWINTLHQYGFKSVAMALSDNSVSIDDEVLKKEEKLAIVLGTEGDGLSKNTISTCDFVAKIPMAHGVDSLNVAAAGALAFWELRKR